MMSSFRPVQKDIELVQPPGDSVAKISFSPTQDILAVASWDNNVSFVWLPPPPSSTAPAH